MRLQADEGSVKLSRDALYRTAVNQRCLSRNAEALATLERLQVQCPGFSRLYEERGHCFLSIDDIPRAIEAFELGVNLNPALLGSWMALERLYRTRDDATKAAIAAEHVARLGRLPPQVVQAGSLFSDGELVSAENILRGYLRTSGSHVEALRMLGRIAHLRGALDDAERLFGEVLVLAPGYRAACADYVRVLVDLRKYRHARDVIVTLLGLEPGNRDYLSLDATVCAGLGEHERAITLFRELLASVPNWPHLHILLGNSLKAVGRHREAIDAYRAAATVRPSFGDAYWSLANLKTYRFAAEEIERMRVEEAAPATQLVDRYHLCFALGKALEDQEEFAASWRYYERGNALKSEQTGYDPEVTETSTRLMMEVFTAEFCARRTGATVSHAAVLSPTPIFIVGLPRAGSTLVEQILASHSQVEGTQELHEIERIAGELQNHRAALAELQPEDFRRLGERYLSDTLAYRKGEAGALAPFYIDKMPNNFRHIGLIHLMLPRAKIIDVRREPMACCFSNLKQLFASGQSFTYSIEGVSRYYRSYLELMQHWDTVLPGRVLRLHYEDLVEDVEAHVRRMLQFCDLEFEPACLEFYNTARNISTASSEQVRQPVFRAGLSQWRHYEPWLGPLKEALGDAVLRYRQ